MARWLDETGLAEYTKKVKTDLDKKVPKEDGKGLSSNDFTDEEKTKLEGIEEGANKYVLPSDVVKDSDYTHTDNNYTDEEKSKLEGIEDGANKYVLPSDVVKDSDYTHTDNNYTDEDKELVGTVEDKVPYEGTILDSTAKIINNAIDLIILSKGGSKVFTYNEIQKNVRSGIAPIAYPIGFTFPVSHSEYGSMSYVVTGHNQIESATGKKYTMTCVPKDCIANAQFDAPEALYANTTTAALAAGTYNFTISSTWSKAVAATYQFTTTVVIPVGGQIVGPSFIADNDPANWRLAIYSGPNSTTALESGITVTAGSEGTSLGNITTPDNDKINHIHRIGYGSNNYAESFIRKVINSDGEKGTYWEPSTKFDRPSDLAATMNGFIYGLDEDFLKIVDYAKVKCGTNTVYESPDSKTTKGSSYEVYDRFFLPSRMEVFGSQDGVNDGSVLMSYYNGAINADRIKLLSGSARYWWLRAPYSGDANNVRNVSTDGSLNLYGAIFSFGCVPACIIA